MACRALPSTPRRKVATCDARPTAYRSTLEPPSVATASSRPHLLSRHSCGGVSHSMEATLLQEPVAAVLPTRSTTRVRRATSSSAALSGAYAHSGPALNAMQPPGLTRVGSTAAGSPRAARSTRLVALRVAMASMPASCDTATPTTVSLAVACHTKGGWSPLSPLPDAAARPRSHSTTERTDRKVGGGGGVAAVAADADADMDRALGAAAPPASAVTSGVSGTQALTPLPVSAVAVTAMPAGCGRMQHTTAPPLPAIPTWYPSSSMYAATGPPPPPPPLLRPTSLLTSLPAAAAVAAAAGAAAAAAAAAMAGVHDEEPLRYCTTIATIILIPTVHSTQTSGLFTTNSVVVLISVIIYTAARRVCIFVV